jgi:2-oxoglutarate dehydrogenase E2 component (dihydrolipoamide succinyltransferase)
MAIYKLLLPKMGESVAEATIIKWVKHPGDYIEADEAVMEIATDKVDSDVPSPVSGRLVEQLYKDNEVVQVGAVIAVIETLVAEAAAPAVHNGPEIITVTEKKEHELNGSAEYENPAVPFISQLTQTKIHEAGESLNDGPRFYSPLVRNIAAHEGIGNAELDQIPGTGTDNRLTKDDLLNYINNKNKKTASASPVNLETQQQEPLAPPAVAENLAPSHTVNRKPENFAENDKKIMGAVSVSGGDEIIEMDRMRRLIADHMVMSKQTSAHVTSFVEADVTNLVLWRERIKKSFEKREGEKITFTPIFIEAAARAIKDFPMINVSVNGTRIIKKKHINIGMATALQNGNLVVPVIKNADELNLTGLAKAVNDLAARARDGKLKPDDVQDGTFTITNVGSFGNMMGTPIINQPQVAILAVGAIKKKPAVIETLQGDMIGIRHMMFLSLSYDHRVVDGALGGTFLKRVADYLENWDTGLEI